MSSTHYTWFSILSTVLHGSISVVTLTIVAIGWVRHRRPGFLVLAVWALVNLFNSFSGIIIGAMQPWLARMFPGVDRIILVQTPYLISYLVSSVLLLAGLALLVFRDMRPRKDLDESTR
jgi:hypothetical protein